MIDRICYAFIIVFFVWVGYIQIVGWRRTKGYKATLEMDLTDRFHEEVVYQLCYKRGYHVTMDMNDDAFWEITDTDHPNKKKVKIIVFMALIKVMMFPFSYRSNKNPDFDDYDPIWVVPTDEPTRIQILMMPTEQETKDILDVAED